MTDTITVTAPISYVRFHVPNFGIISLPPGRRRDGMRELPAVPLADLDDAIFAQLVDAWVNDVYAKHSQTRTTCPCGKA